jgi:hypothetical protein
MPPPARLLPLLVIALLFHLPVSISSRHHHGRNPSPSPAAPSPSSDAAPPAVLHACHATRFQPACVATLSNAGAESSASDLLAATLSALRARIPPAVSTAKSVLAGSSNVNLTNAATNCLTLLSLSSQRLSPSPSPSLLSASTSLLHLYDCWSAYKYVNFSHAISDAMAYLDDTIAVNSNYISMLAARQRYGDDTSRWAPPQTERDGYWPPAAAEGTKTDEDALGVPRGLPANATVCGVGCDYRTVREAVAAAPDLGEGAFVLHVKEGVYKETVSVPWEKTNVVLVGDGMGKTVITGDLNADTPGVSTFNTATVGEYKFIRLPFLLPHSFTYGVCTTHNFILLWYMYVHEINAGEMQPFVCTENAFRGLGNGFMAHDPIRSASSLAFSVSQYYPKF